MRTPDTVIDSMGRQVTCAVRSSFGYGYSFDCADLPHRSRFIKVCRDLLEATSR